MAHQILIIAIAAVILTQIAIFSTSIYLHRALAHRSLSPRPIVDLLFRAALWLVTGQDRQQWVAVHRKHHTFTDKEGDPHSPLLLGFWKVQLWNVYYYIQEARNPVTVAKFAPDLGPDRWERLLFSRGWTGLFLGAALTGAFIGWWQGVVAMLAHAFLYVFVRRSAHQRAGALAGRPEFREHRLQLAGAGLADRRREPAQQPSRLPPLAEVQPAALRAGSLVARHPCCWPPCVWWRS